MPIMEHTDPQEPQDLPADGEPFNGRVVGYVAIVGALAFACVLMVMIISIVTGKTAAELWQVVSSGWVL